MTTLSKNTAGTMAIWAFGRYHASRNDMHFNSTSYAKWGANAADGTDKLVLGSATFPTGFELQFYANAAVSALPEFDVRSNNKIKVYRAAIQAGGDARTNAAHACKSAEFRTSAAISVITLEQLIATTQGTRCVFGKATVLGTTANGGPRTAKSV